jgi:hypothetical protein
MKTVDDLREHLFAALQGLKDGTLDVERAKAISEVSQTIINSAKVEVEAARLVEASTAPKFLGGEQPMPQGITSIRQHRIKG